MPEKERKKVTERLRGEKKKAGGGGGGGGSAGGGIGRKQ